MVGRGEALRATIKGRIEFQSDVDKAKLLYLMRLFRDAVEFAHNLLRRKVNENKITKLIHSRILNNAHYSRSALQRAKLYRKQLYLKLRKPQLFSIGKSNEKGNRNIRFISTDKVKIKIPSADGKHKWIVVNVRFGEKYLGIIHELCSASYPYSATVCIKNVRGRQRFYLYISVPIELYSKYLRIKPKNKQPGKNIASFDFNPTQIAMTILDFKGLLLDFRKEVFPNIVNLPKTKAQDIRRKALKKLVEYAINHGVGVFVVEELKKTKTKTKSRKTNRKISKFALREYLQHIEVLAERCGCKLVGINPAYTSVIGRFIARDLGVDVHTASAFALGLRYLRR